MDGFTNYAALVWPQQSQHVVSQLKEETYTIEGINADLRTYLGRLARRSCCFSRSLEALRKACVYSPITTIVVRISSMLILNSKASYVLFYSHSPYFKCRSIVYYLRLVTICVEQGLVMMLENRTQFLEYYRQLIFT